MVRNQMCQKTVRRNIERHAQQFVATSLGHCARQLVPIMDVELAYHMARGQRHFVELGWIPRGHNKTTTRALGGVFERVDDLLELVYATAKVVLADATATASVATASVATA